MPQNILLVEDNEPFRQIVRRVLVEHDYSVREAATGKEGLLLAREEPPDLIVLDLILPGIRGMEVCARLKSDPATAGVPVLILTGNDRDGQEVACLELGADDYLIKPVKTELLLARCRALLRRTAAGKAAEKVFVGTLTLDYQRKIAVLAGREFPNLTPKEFDMLYELARLSPEPIDRAALYRRVWGAEPPSEGSLKTVDVHARRIRLKLGWQASEWLTYVSGRGYRLSSP